MALLGRVNKCGLEEGRGSVHWKQAFKRPMLFYTVSENRIAWRKQKIDIGKTIYLQLVTPSAGK